MDNLSGLQKLARMYKRLGVPMLPMAVQIEGNRITITTLPSATIEYGRRRKPNAH
jgi:hypothetical protein